MEVTLEGSGKNFFMTCLANLKEMQVQWCLKHDVMPLLTK